MDVINFYVINFLLFLVLLKCIEINEISKKKVYKMKGTDTNAKTRTLNIARGQ